MNNQEMYEEQVGEISPATDSSPRDVLLDVRRLQLPLKLRPILVYYLGTRIKLSRFNDLPREFFLSLIGVGRKYTDAILKLRRELNIKYDIEEINNINRPIRPIKE